MSSLRFEVIETNNNILDDYKDCKTFTIKTNDNIDLCYLIEAIFYTLIHNNKRSKDVSIIGYLVDGKSSLIKSFYKPDLILDSKYVKIEVFIKNKNNSSNDEIKNDETYAYDLSSFNEFICNNIFN